MKTTDTSRVLFILLLLGAVGVFLFSIGKGRPPEPDPVVSWMGETMGTTYQIQLADVTLEPDVLDDLTQRVTAELVAVNDAMSTYIPESEISRFNALESTEEVFGISERFQQVMVRSMDLYSETAGAFDPTLGPLIDLWGFGAGSGSDARPEEEQVRALLETIGLDRIELQNGSLRKTVPEVEINLSAIAKGYAVDRLVALLRDEGFQNIYVEIGGEVSCLGVNGLRVPWRIGIQVPERDAGSSVLRVVRLQDRALATSGDYRNYLEDEDMNRHHILDPRTGLPAEHRLASVSVLAEDCMTADAVATALYVMGTEEGMTWLSDKEGLDAFFIDREAGGFRVTSTPGFDQALVAVP
jgi:thiamine biosynthesis lipoprotein